MLWRVGVSAVLTVGVTVRTVYADGRPVATQVAMTVQGRIDDQFGYELRLISSRWGSAYGFFTSDSGRVTADCDGDRVNLQMNSNAGLGATVLPRLDWANAPATLRFTVGR